MCQAWGPALGILCGHHNYPLMVTTVIVTVFQKRKQSLTDTSWLAQSHRASQW